jgi:hypothetical protein
MDPRPMNRRDALQRLGGAGAALAAMMLTPPSAGAQRGRYEVGYGLYGMRPLPGRPLPGSSEADHESPEEGIGLAHVAVRPRDRRRVHLDEDLIILRDLTGRPIEQ